jgi:hypothetical protein
MNHDSATLRPDMLAADEEGGDCTSPGISGTVGVATGSTRALPPRTPINDGRAYMSATLVPLCTLVSLLFGGTIQGTAYGLALAAELLVPIVP